jgi:hypothetical protein
MRILILLIFFLFSFIFETFSQKGMTSVGIQIKPIVPFSVLTKDESVNDVQGVHFETAIHSGYTAGLIVRHNFTNLIAIESGISYCRRKYSLIITDAPNDIQSYSRIISYEIPAMFMVYAQVGEKTYINGSLGPILNMFASDVAIYDSIFQHVAFRNQVFNPGVAANVGFEYRTEKSGTLYLGASFQRPFSYIYLSKVGYYGNGKEVIVENELSGTYLTIDLRYYFPTTKSKNIDE